MAEGKSFQGELHGWGIVALHKLSINEKNLETPIKVCGNVVGFNRNDKVILTSNVVKRDGDFIETLNSVYLLVGECDNIEKLDEYTKAQWDELCQK